MPSSPDNRVDDVTLSTRLSWRARWSVRRAARQDARAGLPVGLSAETTPALAEVLALYGNACERERTAFLADQSQAAVQQRRLEAVIDNLRESLRRCSERVDRASRPTNPTWLTTRMPGEDQLTDSAVRTRRAVAHRRELEAVLAEQQAVRQELDQALVDLADVQASAQRRAELARSRVQRHRDLAHRTAAIYRQALLRRHPQRDELVGRWTTDLCAIPAWAVEVAPLPSEATVEMPA